MNMGRQSGRAASAAGALVVALGLSAAAEADVLLRNEADRFLPLLSVENMEVGWAITADDFEFTRSGTITSVTAVFYIEFGDPLPSMWRLYVLPDVLNEPGSVPIATFFNGQAERTDLWDDGETLWETWEVTWNTDSLSLSRGRYWVAPMAVQLGEAADHLIFWSSSNTGKLKWRGAMLRSPELGVQNWTEMLFNDCALVDGAFTLRGSGGGAPEFDNIPMRTLDVPAGEIISGGRPELREVDREFAVFQSRLVQGGNIAAKLIVDSTFRVDENLDVEDLLVRLIINTTEPGGTAKVYLKNWQTGKWKRVFTFATETHDDFYSIEGLDPDKYIKQNGTVMVRLKVTTVTNFDPEGFKANLEELRLDVLLE